MTIELPSLSPGDTVRIGEKIGRQLKGNEIIFLVGDLGAGKTLLTKGIARSLGIDPEEVVSPTFTLINQFQGTNDRRLYHVDLYRLGEATYQGLPEIDDYIDEGVIVIEWAQYLHPSYFKLKHAITITLELDKNNENQRLIKIDTLLGLKDQEPF
jgi:tRNA threonylcarbamoyladenosine biosynthesis protein TsaE